MKKKSANIHDNEIDLVEIFKILYLEKWKIIILTISSFLIGIFYINFTPGNFQVDVEFGKSPESQFIKYLSLRSALKEHDINENSLKQLRNNPIIFNSNNILEVHEINPDNLIQDFVFEFDQIQTRVDILESYFNNNKSDTINSKMDILSIAKSFKVNYSSENDLNRIIFHYPELENIVPIVAYTINRTLDIVKKNKIRDLKALNDHVLSVQSGISNQLEQSIHILTSEINEASKMNNSNQSSSFNQMISNANNQLLLELKSRLFQNENSNINILLKTVIEEFSNENPSSFINYSVSFLDIKSLKNEKFYGIFFALLGFLISLLVILIKNLFQNKRIKS